MNDDKQRSDLDGELASTIEKGFISTRELSDLLGVEQGTLAAWRRRGIGPAWYQIEGHLIRYDGVEVVAWMRCQRAGRSPDAPQRSAQAPPLPDNGKEGLQ